MISTNVKLIDKNGTEVCTFKAEDATALPGIISVNETLYTFSVVSFVDGVTMIFREDSMWRITPAEIASGETITAKVKK